MATNRIACGCVCPAGEFRCSAGASDHRVEVEGHVLRHGQREIVYTKVGLARQVVDQSNVAYEGRLRGQHRQRVARRHALRQAQLLLGRLDEALELDGHLLHEIGVVVVVQVGRVGAPLLVGRDVNDLAEYLVEHVVRLVHVAVSATVATVAAATVLPVVGRTRGAILLGQAVVQTLVDKIVALKVAGVGLHGRAPGAQRVYGLAVGVNEPGLLVEIRGVWNQSATSRRQANDQRPARKKST